MAESISIKEQLRYLKGITVMTGGVHEAQALQLKNYPIVINDVKSAKTKIDPEKKMVWYTLKVSETFKSDKLMEQVCDAIVTWVRTIVWDDTAVVFMIGKDVIYDSRNRG